ncbi:hypothetical protein [Azospirillum agricola]|uniref:hypothetical protein n=1 Tax=Azospirillum agricola TaxID=1720247 RepID=UPI000A0F32ED|nr:hypothetical protein [Azospirillum agricola]SMH43425.1 hypothetical protein SAMN02982994_1883 [Azospirillum lipoferum]
MERHAVALGGFGGFNLHGAGVLTALERLGTLPDLFTVTSGQIVVLAAWLRGEDIRSLLLDGTTGGGLLRAWRTALFGHSGVFRPALHDHARRWLDVPLSPEAVLERLMPARQYAPVRDGGHAGEIAHTLNEAAVGVVFNTYDVRAGEGVLHGNAAARRLMAGDVGLEDITPEAVESALWLYLYGFDEAPGGLIDGAYHRSVILAELHGFERVTAAAPFPVSWIGPVPRNQLEVENWKIRQWFANSYKAEVARLRRVVELIDRGTLRDPAYRIRGLTELPLRQHYGFFDYFTEKEEVYEDALAQSLDHFAPPGPGGAGQQPPDTGAQPPRVITPDSRTNRGSDVFSPS